MKKIYKTILLSLFTIFSLNSFAVVYQISVNNSSFSPSSLSVNVGDTIVWTLNSAFGHTTTSTNIPAGAQSWDSPINSGNPAFAYIVEVEGTYDYICTPHGFSGQFNAIISDIETPEVFSGFNIYTIQPSVYNLSFNLSKTSNVKLSIYDLTGKQVKVLSNSVVKAGEYSAIYNLDDLRQGVYVFEMLVDNKRLSKRLLVN